jgi:hypothetical protein
MREACDRLAPNIIGQNLGGSTEAAILPAPGTPARIKLDREQAEMVTGLLKGYAAHRGLGESLSHSRPS